MNRLRELRMAAHLSQKELAERVNAAQTTVSQWEVGSRDLDSKTLIRLCKYFNVSADYFLCVSEDKSLIEFETDQLQSTENNRESIFNKKLTREMREILINVDILKQDRELTEKEKKRWLSYLSAQARIYQQFNQQ